MARICDLDKKEEAKIYDMLDCDRQQSIKLIKNNMAKKRSMFAGLLLRYAFLQEGYSKEEWEQVKVEREMYGKPYIKNYHKFKYSLSHSKDWVLCAVDTEPIGADIQEIRLWNIQIAKRFYSKEEYNRLLKFQEKDLRNEQTRMFYSMWTAKESASKYSGRGIGTCISCYVTDECYSCIYNKEEIALGLHIKLYDELEGYIACLCSNCNSFPEKLEQIDIMEENRKC